jgi:hypothetical protein
VRCGSVDDFGQELIRRQVDDEATSVVLSKLLSIW